MAAPLDPRVAPAPPSALQKFLDEHAAGFSAESLAPTERERMRYEEMLTARRDKEIQRIHQLKAEAQQALQNMAGQNGLAQMMQRRDMIEKAEMQAAMQQSALNYGMQEHSFVAKKPMVPNFPNMSIQRPTEPTPLDATGDSARQAQDHGLMNMNQIARAKYAPLFDLLDIKLRFTHAGLSGMIKQWVIAKMGKDGRMIRQEWTAPSRDTACSLRTWDAMVAELLDEVARRDGVEINTEHSADPAVTRDEASGSAGHP